MKVTLVLAATTPKLGIGKNGSLPWRLKKEMKYFRQVTQGGTVLMGRKTWESIPPKFRPLPGRQNVVITRGELDLGEEVKVAKSIEEALQISDPSKPVYVIGGGQIYSASLAYANHILLTMIEDPEGKIDCDTFFNLNKSEWEQQSTDALRRFVNTGTELPDDCKEHEAGYKYTYTLWTRSS